MKSTKCVFNYSTARSKVFQHWQRTALCLRFYSSCHKNVSHELVPVLGRANARGVEPRASELDVHHLSLRKMQSKFLIIFSNCISIEDLTCGVGEMVSDQIRYAVHIFAHCHEWRSQSYSLLSIKIMWILAKINEMIHIALGSAINTRC